jgi:hypothetical protein
LDLQDVPLVDVTQTVVLEASPQQRRLHRRAVVQRHLAVLCRAVKVQVLVAHRVALLRSRVMMLRVQRLVVLLLFLVDVVEKLRVAMLLLRRVSVENK